MENNMPNYTETQQNAIANAFAVITKQQDLDTHQIDQPIFTMRHIHAFTHDDVHIDGLRAALMKNINLRKIYDNMMMMWQENQQLSYCDQVIAADDGQNLTQRHGDGFVISFTPSSVVTQEIYITITIEEWRNIPTHIMITHDDGMVEKFALNEFDDNHKSMMIANINSPLVQSLQDKTYHHIALAHIKNKG